MAKRIRYEDDKRNADGPSRFRSAVRSIRHLVVTLLALALMLYGAALTISRTGGFRAYVQSEVSEQLGFDVAVASAALTPRMELEISGITAGRPDAPGTPCVRADRVQIGWSLRPAPGIGRVRSIRVETGVVAFAQGADGSWVPSILAGAADELVKGAGLGLDDLRRAPAPAAPEAVQPNPPAAGPPGLCRVVVRGLDVLWWKADRTKLAAIEGLDVDVTPMDVPGHRVLHIRASARSYERTRGEWISPFQVECLWGDGQRTLLNAALGAPPGPEPAALPSAPPAATP